MNRTTKTSLMAGAAGVGMAAATLAGAGDAAAADPPFNKPWVEVTAKDNGNCTATFTVKSSTSLAGFQPDWWYKSEGKDEWINATKPQDGLTPPWRNVANAWPIARYVDDGSGALVSAPGSIAEHSTVSKTQSFKKLKPKDGKYEISYRIKLGPERSYYNSTPKPLTITGCKSGGNGSVDLGSLDKLFPRP